MSQWIEYAKKKGDQLYGLAIEHIRCREPDKAKELLTRAIGWYKKAGLEDKIQMVKDKLKEIS